MPPAISSFAQENSAGSRPASWSSSKTRLLCERSSVNFLIMVFSLADGVTLQIKVRLCLSSVPGPAAGTYTPPESTCRSHGVAAIIGNPQVTCHGAQAPAIT